MNHQQYREWLLLSMYDELTPDEASALQRHLHDCGECRHELEELRRLHTTLADAGAVEPGESLLGDARQRLRTALRAERSRRTFRERVAEFLADFFLPDYRTALGGLALLAAGILAGRFLLSPAPTQEVRPAALEPQAQQGEPRISNIRFIDADASDGEVEFLFDATTPVHVKGSINDERIQKTLAHALVNDRNPGVRLRSVNAFSTQVENLRQPDKDVKAALILAATTDDNPAVRKEALKTLGGFPFDEEIKQACLHVLMRDANPALRIAAINRLDSARTQTGDTDNRLLEVLKQRMHSDDNSYVRIRAKAVLEEIKQQ